MRVTTAKLSGINRVRQSVLLSVLLLIFVLSTLCGIVMRASFADAAAPTDTPSFVSRFGSFGVTRHGDASAITYDADGNKYILTQYTIYKYDENDVYVTKWGDYGCIGSPYGAEYDGSLCWSEDIIFHDGSLYVADSNNNRIEQFDTDGNFIRKWGTAGTGVGEFAHPNAIAFDSSGNILVSDSQNVRVQKFSSTGTYLDSWSGGPSWGYSGHLKDIVVDSNDDVYVIHSNNTVRKYDSSGTYLGDFATYGTGVGQINRPHRLVIDDNNIVYVYDEQARIQRFHTDGSFIDSWADPEITNHPTYAFGFAIAPDGSQTILYRNDDDHQVELHYFSAADGGYSGMLTEFNVAPGQMNYPASITVDQAGNRYVADAGTNRIIKFDANNNQLMEWGEYGTAPGQFNQPMSIKYNPADDHLYVDDVENGRIQVFTTDGTYVRSIGSLGTGDGELYYPFGFTFDNDGKLHVIDSGNQRVQVFDTNGTYLSQWNFTTPPGEYGALIAIDSHDKVHIIIGDTIHVYTLSGTHLYSWGGTGSGNGQFKSPGNIEIDPAGYIYVADVLNYRIQKFDSDGTYLAQWGTQGNGDGQMQQPVDITFTPDGTVLVADGGTSQIQTYRYASSASTSANSSLVIPAYAQTTCYDEMTPENISHKDPHYAYPAGLVKFCLASAKGATLPVDLKFTTDLLPSQIVVRKYNSTSHHYETVSNVTVSDGIEGGKHFIRLQYRVTDGGENDEDGIRNGVIIDPIGLGVPVAVVPNAPNAGVSSTYGVYILVGLMTGFITCLLITNRSTRQYRGIDS